MSTVQTSTLLTVCKIRWIPKLPIDQMTITNFEAIRLQATAILLEQQEKWAEANAAQAQAKDILEKELREYLSGLKMTIPIASDDTFGMGDLGGVL